MHVNIEKVAGKTASDAKFSIVIPSWNNLAYLRLCIESIKKHSKYRHQIIVHINEGIDGTLDWVKSQSDISYSYSKENIGVCYALNSCRTLVTTNYLLYINDDMYVCPSWDAPLAKAIEETGHTLFFFSSTTIELKAQSNCSIQHDFGKDIHCFKEADVLELCITFVIMLLDEFITLLTVFSTEFAPPMIIFIKMLDKY
jgi:glycosyltransferase involved in cell wall biosynthesis